MWYVLCPACKNLMTSALQCQQAPSSARRRFSLALLSALLPLVTARPPLLDCLCCCCALQVQGRVPVKDNREVTYPSQLNLMKYCTAGALNDGWGSVYQLAGIGRHLGGNAQMGHYQYMQKLANGAWILRDDDRAVKPISEQYAMSCCREACALVYFRAPPARYNCICVI